MFTFSFPSLRFNLNLHEHFVGFDKQGVLRDLHLASVGGKMPLKSISYTKKG